METWFYILAFGLIANFFITVKLSTDGDRNTALIDSIIKTSMMTRASFKDLSVYAAHFKAVIDESYHNGHISNEFRIFIHSAIASNVADIIKYKEKNQDLDKFADELIAKHGAPNGFK